MSDNAESAPEPKAPKKSRLGLVLAIVVVVVLVTGAAVAGTMFGPVLLGHKQAAADSADQADDEGGDDDATPPDKSDKKKQKKSDKEGKIGESVELPPIVVDARSKDGELHHLKVVLAVEVAEGTPKDDFMRYSPRGREAAVAYLRSRSFEDLASSDHYAEIRTELAKQFIEAVGEKRVARVLIIDYVAQ